MDFQYYPRFQEFLHKNIMAVDYGSKVTGLALFRPGTDLKPYPYNRIIFRTEAHLFEEILRFAKESEVDLLILGIPYLTDGKETNATCEMKSLGNRLRAFIDPLELYFQDETLSTFEAESRMKEDPRYNFKIDMTKIDMLSACIILEDFIRSPQCGLKKS